MISHFQQSFGGQKHIVYTKVLSFLINVLSLRQKKRIKIEKNQQRLNCHVCFAFTSLKFPFIKNSHRLNVSLIQVTSQIQLYSNTLSQFQQH